MAPLPRRRGTVRPDRAGVLSDAGRNADSVEPLQCSACTGAMTIREVMGRGSRRLPFVEHRTRRELPALLLAKKFDPGPALT